MKLDERLFLKQLSLHLKGLPQEEIDEIIAEYADYFSEARERGLSDVQIIEQLGHPREIVQDILANRSEQSPLRLIILTIALIFFNVTFVLGPVLGLIGAYIGLFVALIVCITSPILAMIKVVFFDGYLFELFATFFLCGLSILLMPYLKTGAKIGYELLQKYAKWNVNIVKGENL